MAKQTKPPHADMKDCCRRCVHNTGEGVMGWMNHCSFLDYCVPFGWHKCEAEEKGKGKFKEKK